MRERVYVCHVCKNSRKPEFIGDKKNKKPNPEYCNNIWVDVDRTGAVDFPTSQFYCPKCQAKGYKNPKLRLTPEEKAELSEKMKLVKKGKRK